MKRFKQIHIMVIFPDGIDPHVWYLKIARTGHLLVPCALFFLWQLFIPSSGPICPAELASHNTHHLYNTQQITSK